MGFRFISRFKNTIFRLTTVCHVNIFQFLDVLGDFAVSRIAKYTDLYQLYTSDFDIEYQFSLHQE